MGWGGGGYDSHARHVHHETESDRGCGGVGVGWWYDSHARRVHHETEGDRGGGTIPMPGMFTTRFENWLAGLLSRGRWLNWGRGRGLFTCPGSHEVQARPPRV